MDVLLRGLLLVCGSVVLGGIVWGRLVLRAGPGVMPDGAVAPVQFPPRDFCLASHGMLELDLDPADVLPPLKTDRPDLGPIVR